MANRKTVDGTAATANSGGGAYLKDSSGRWTAYYPDRTMVVRSMFDDSHFDGATRTFRNRSHVRRLIRKWGHKLPGREAA